MKRDPERTQKTCEKLKNAFWEVYSEKPIDKITVREISQRAGYNRSTFYTYYKDIYDILEQSEEEIFKTLISHDPVPINLLDKDYYRRSIMVYGEFLEQNKTCLRVLMSENGDPKFTYKLVEIMRQKINEGMNDFMADIDADMHDYIVEFVMNCHSSVMSLWLKRNCDVPFEKLTDYIFRLMCGGIVPLISGESDPYEKVADIVVQKIKQRIDDKYFEKE